MECQTTERIAFKQPLFARAELAERWPALEKYICSGVTLEAAFENASRRLEGQVPRIARGNANEALEFYNKVVADGRYIDLMARQPDLAAEKLGYKISPDALKDLKAVQEFIAPGVAVANVAVVAIAVAVTVVIVKGSNPMEEIVIDASGLVKM